MGQHVAEDHFTVVGTNPNPNGRCLFNPHGEHPGCEGPYIVFNAIAAPIGGELASGKELIQASACVKCLREAIADAERLVGDGRVEVGEESELSMYDKMNAQPKPNYAFSDLPKDEQVRLLQEVGPGETVRYGKHVVLIPGSKKTRTVVQSEPLSAPDPFSVVGISGKALEDPGEVPGKRRGTYETAVDEGDIDILAEIAED